MGHNLDAMRLSGVGRCRPMGAYDDEVTEAYEDSTRARRPSEAGAIVVTAEVVERFRGMLICKLRRKKVSLRDLGRILNISHERVRQIYHEIPPATRIYYERLEFA